MTKPKTVLTLEVDNTDPVSVANMLCKICSDLDIEPLMFVMASTFITEKIVETMEEHSGHN